MNKHYLKSRKFGRILQKKKPPVSVVYYTAWARGYFELNFIEQTLTLFSTELTQF